MRILLVGNYVLNKQSSMLRYAAMLCREMQDRGHQVELIQPPIVFGDLVAQPMVRKWLGYIDSYVLFPWKLRLRARDFDLVHVCDHSNSMYLAHVGDRPSSITCHDLLAIRSAQGEFSGQRSRVSYSGKIQQRWIFKHLARARNVVCVSENTARELASLCGKTTQRITVIANALNPTYGSAASDESVAQARRRLGLATGERYLIHVGKDTWYKNRSGVLRIFQHLLERLGNGAPALRLVMAGQSLSNDLRDFVVRNLPERSMIEVANPSDEELRALYTGATGLLFPSLHEGFGWPLIEAQGCGCPVITSNRSPMSEVAGAAALYIDPADEPGAARLIAASLNGLEELREAGRQNAKRFDPATIISMYERFFVGLVPTCAS